MIPPDYWPAFPLIELIDCPDCGRTCKRYWDGGEDFECDVCGISF